MRLTRRTTFGLIGAALVALVAGPEVAYAADPIKIGMTVSQTGRFALAAQSGERGLKIWIDDVNTRGGVDVGGEKRMISIALARLPLWLGRGLTKNSGKRSQMWPPGSLEGLFRRKWLSEKTFGDRLWKPT